MAYSMILGELMFCYESKNGGRHRLVTTALPRRQRTDPAYVGESLLWEYCRYQLVVQHRDSRPLIDLEALFSLVAFLFGFEEKLRYNNERACEGLL